MTALHHNLKDCVGNWCSQVNLQQTDNMHHIHSVPEKWNHQLMPITLWKPHRFSRSELSFSTGSVATCFGCGGPYYIVYGFCLQFTPLSNGERISKMVRFGQSYCHQLMVHIFGTQCTYVVSSAAVVVLLWIFTARAYARVVLGVVILFVCLSVCHTRGLWQKVTKLNDALQIFLYHTIGQSLCYSDTQSGWSATPPSLWNLRSKWPTTLRKTQTSTDFRS